MSLRGFVLFSEYPSNAPVGISWSRVDSVTKYEEADNVSVITFNSGKTVFVNGEVPTIVDVLDGSYIPEDTISFPEEK